MSESKEDDWGFYATDASDSESSAEVDQSSGSDGRQSESNLGSSGGGTSMGSSTAGLAELNSLMHDSCEMGVAAWTLDGRRIQMCKALPAHLRTLFKRPPNNP